MNIKNSVWLISIQAHHPFKHRLNFHFFRVFVYTISIISKII